MKAQSALPYTAAFRGCGDTGRSPQAPSNIRLRSKFKDPLYFGCMTSCQETGVYRGCMHTIESDAATCLGTCLGSGRFFVAFAIPQLGLPSSLWISAMQFINRQTGLKPTSLSSLPCSYMLNATHRGTADRAHELSYILPNSRNYFPFRRSLLPARVMNSLSRDSAGPPLLRLYYCKWIPCLSSACDVVHARRTINL